MANAYDPIFIGVYLSKEYRFFRKVVQNQHGEKVLSSPASDQMAGIIQFGNGKAHFGAEHLVELGAPEDIVCIRAHVFDYPFHRHNPGSG